MCCCGDKCKKSVAFIISIILITLGFLLVFGWENAVINITNNELSLQNNSKGLSNWIVTPIPMYLTFYLYNWTNAQEVLKDWSIKPVLQECGPYVFSEKHYRVDLQWNANDTVTYKTKRVWHFLPEKSNGSLSDQITSINVIALTIANMVRDKNFFFKQAVEFFLKEKEKSLAITRNASQWLFDGFDDELLALAKKLNLSINNMEKFGWFYGRNNSADYDGTVTMYTGKNDINLLGIFEEWNGRPTSSAYNSYCGFVNGTSGELWPPVKHVSKVSIFATDLCSSLNLFETTNAPFYHGLEGKEYVGTDFLFDNGTKYPEQACFSGPIKYPSGVRDVSKCKFGAPAFISYPHFYLADEVYRNSIVGMKPNATKHKFKIALEPNSGVPLEVNARLQLNILVSPIKGIEMIQSVKTTMLPVIWFEQSALLSEELASEVKTILILPNIGLFTGIGLLAMGTLIFCIAIYITIKSAWKDTDQTQLLPDRM